MGRLSSAVRQEIIKEVHDLFDHGATIRVDGVRIRSANELLRPMIEDPQIDETVARTIAAQLHNIRTTIGFSRLDLSHKKNMSAIIRIDLSRQSDYWVDFEFF